MTKYYTRVNRRRLYCWVGRPFMKDRKVFHLQYTGLVMKSGDTEEVTINPGDFVLIEGEVEDRPFVARLKELYDDGAEKDASKHAVVQWFLRYEEVPYKKRKLLGRDPHPQEIFFNNFNICENDIDAETIIGTVQVIQLKPENPFPQAKKSGNVLYVKLSWDGKSFIPLSSSLSERKDEKIVHNGPVSEKPLPKPQFYSQNGDAGENRQITRSATRVQRKEAEIESRHSSSKNSLSKERGAQRIPNGTDTPGARKKLQLNSPPNSRCRLPVERDSLDEFKALEPAAPKRRVVFSGLQVSPPKKMLTDEDLSLRGLSETKQESRHSLRLTPLKPASSDERKSSRNRPLEEHNGGGPQTPRSLRKSAQKTTSLIRRQIRILSEDDIEDIEDLDEDTDFVPEKKSTVSSSSEDDEEENDDDEDAEIEDKKSPKRVARKRWMPRTPTSSRKSSARTPNKTPGAKAAHTATPKIPERNQPVQKPSNVLEEARIRLHVSAVPESLPCREQEYQDVYNFVESKLLDGTGGCMYISGVPGTGKTATVHEVIRSLQTAAEDDDLPSFQFIEINGMKLTDPHQAYVQVLKLLTGQKATADHAAALLEKRFSTAASNRETTVLLVDELDLLWTRKQNVMYSLFDWPTRKRAKLIVLAIANTMDLPERIMMNRVASRLGLTRMSFQPYTHKQLQQIITSRLNHVKAFEDDAIQLVSRKVAALSGDARRCLDICRRATEICEFSSKKGELSLVKMPHVIEALDEMFSSPYVLAIRSASVQEQAFLKAVIAEFRRSGLEESTFQQVYHQYIVLCRIEGIAPPSMSETMAVCLRLGASRLLLVESSRNDLYLRVRMNVSQDDIMYALREE
ncbi:origin recognition complex subunit 1 isoform X2 [Phyllobates terribilis]|uniref:origin recognition complex subunit 1 isoform X2 n=1 Tax=Phyllobates terribilis TaxID=111132 RepID=UPI003CCB2EC9